jgi:hypothetical protein
MDFVFNCALCHGPLVARTDLHGLHVQCAHCLKGTEVGEGTPVTEALTNTILDGTAPTPNQPILRRVRPALQYSSAGASHNKPRLPRKARISYAL